LYNIKIFINSALTENGIPIAPVHFATHETIANFIHLQQSTESSRYKMNFNILLEFNCILESVDQI